MENNKTLQGNKIQILKINLGYEDQSASNVREIIDLLKEYPQDLNVYVDTGEEVLPLKVGRIVLDNK